MRCGGAWRVVFRRRQARESCFAANPRRLCGGADMPFKSEGSCVGAVIAPDAGQPRFAPLRLEFFFSPRECRRASALIAWRSFGGLSDFQCRRGFAV